MVWLLCALACAPLVVTKSLFFPYISGKNIFIRLVITVVVTLFVWMVFVERKKSFFVLLLERCKTFFRNKITFFVSVFMLVLVISTLFAVNPFRAFFGDLERGEGLLTLLYLFGLFVLCGLLFEKKDWILFFKGTILVGYILFIQQISELLSGVDRPAASTGNPIYLATIFLFVLFSAWEIIRYYQSGEKKLSTVLWTAGSYLIILCSVFGMFATKTRGAIAGFFVGIVVVLLYMLVGKEYGAPGLKKQFRKWAVGILGALVFIGIVFIATSQAGFWKHIPGFDRLSEFTLNDATLQTRLISLGVSLQAINPAGNGVGTFLFGWGMENFNVAYNAYYNPKYFQFEQAWFDRAHNKLMDVLVMNGLTGLIAYVGIWGALWVGLRKKEEGVLRQTQDSIRNILPILFFSVAYFVQNLFVFDSIVTYVPFFTFLAYVAYVQTGEGGYSVVEQQKSKQNVLQGKLFTLFPSIVAICAIFYIIAFIAWTWIPYGQTHAYIQFIRQQKGVSVKDVAPLFKPYTFVQELIRQHFLRGIVDQYSGKSGEQELFLFGVSQLQDLVSREPHNPRFFITLGDAYGGVAKRGLAEYFVQAEGAYQKAYALTPKRQDVRYLLAFNYAQQGKTVDAIRLLRETIDLNPQAPDSYYHLGVIYTATNEYDAGLRELSVAFSMNPEKYKQLDQFKAAILFLEERYQASRNTAQLDRVREIKGQLP